MKTKYRTVNNGIWDLLQYEAEVTNLLWRLFGCTKEWKYVPAPYYHSTYGRHYDLLSADTRVNSLRENLEQFVKDYPDIRVYLQICEKKQAELEAEVAKNKAAQEVRKTKIRYFD